jgi:hypothetical protein
MHFEILVEDRSGKNMLDILVPRIIGQNHTYKVHPYKGIGHVPSNMRDAPEASKRKLLDNLPRLLKGYGNTYYRYPPDSQAAVFVVCDLDSKCLKLFRQNLDAILSQCHPAPKTRFCIAIEEGEAWFLGDIPAVKAAYPRAKDAVLNAYDADSICGTWECLANAILAGGAKSIISKGYQAVGAEKSVWAEKIAPHMDVEQNSSPSFRYFREKLRELAGPSL